VLLTVTVAALLALPPAALGADAYVDFETGADDAGCGPIAQPCLTIHTGILRAGSGDAVRVDDRTGVYGNPAVPIVLGAGKSLVGEEFVDGDESVFAEPDTVIDALDLVSSNPAVRVAAGDPAGTIQNLRLHGTIGIPLRLDAAATVTGNVFDEDNAVGGGCHVRVANAGNTATISSNAIFDPTPGVSLGDGVCVESGAAPTIAGNSFVGLNDGVLSAGGDSVISENTFLESRGMTTDAAIRVTSGAPTITANQIGDPGDANIVGIWIEQPAASLVGAALRRNTVFEHRVGLAVNDTQGSVTLNGDLIGGSTLVGMAINDSGNDDATAMLATNVTVSASAGAELSLNNTTVALNSVILGGPDPGVAVSGDATCGISFSRGPSIAADPDGCRDFSTTADPGFVNAGMGDFHLAPGSAMIDMGDPAAPLAGVLDLDGESRQTDGNGDGIARRDIGADETAAAPMQGSAQPSAPAKPKPKCKKRKKKRAAGAAKKKGKKCKRKRRRRPN
jgi:hypothetical protein